MTDDAESAAGTLRARVAELEARHADLMALHVAEVARLVRWNQTWKTAAHVQRARAKAAERRARRLRQQMRGDG